MNPKMLDTGILVGILGIVIGAILSIATAIWSVFYGDAARDRYRARQARRDSEKSAKLEAEKKAYRDRVEHAARDPRRLTIELDSIHLQVSQTMTSVVLFLGSFATIVILLDIFTPSGLRRGYSAYPRGTSPAFTLLLLLLVYFVLGVVMAAFLRVSRLRRQERLFLKAVQDNLDSSWETQFEVGTDNDGG